MAWDFKRPATGFRDGKIGEAVERVGRDATRRAQVRMREGELSMSGNRFDAIRRDKDGGDSIFLCVRRRRWLGVLDGEGTYGGGGVWDARCALLPHFACFCSTGYSTP